MRISDWSSDVCSSDLNALFLFSQIWPRLGQHWSLDLGPELADRRIDFDAFDLPDSPADRYTLAAFLAAHLSFQLAAWHEIAQWYGYHTVPGFPERLSAFSPEDLYSNVLGARLGLLRSEERRVGKGWVRKGRYR